MHPNPAHGLALIGQMTVTTDPTNVLVLIGVVSVLALIFLAVIARYHYKQAGRKADQQHLERMKLLDLGQPLPDAVLAKISGDNRRTAAAAVIGVLVPLVLVAGAVGVTALVLARPGVVPGGPPVLTSPAGLSGAQLALLCTVWGVAGLVSLLAVILSLVAVRRGSRRTRPEKEEVSEESSRDEPQSPVMDEPKVELDKVGSTR